MIISNCGAWLVDTLSLLSKNTTVKGAVADAVKARP
jgi:hypothetical protein